MAPFKSSLAKSGKKLIGFFNQSDLSLRGATQSIRKPPQEELTVSYLVIAGGGGGGAYVGGGGGAGGYRESSSAKFFNVS